MADSQSLRLLSAAADLHGELTGYVAQRLCSQGFAGISPAMLHFLGALDCGINYGAEIARRLQVSRQMVAKTVKELCRAGYLEQVEGAGRQKQILFTEEGERLMSAARLVLAELDQVFVERFSTARVDETAAQLEALKRVLVSRREQD